MQAIAHRMDKKVLLHSTENSIKYPMTSHNGKEYKKECTYMYKLNHFGVQQKFILHCKLTIHCKSTILK